MPARLHASLTDHPLSVEAAHAFVTDPACGAVVVFTGTVREESEGRRVTALSYEAYAEQAERQLAALAAEVAEKWPAVQAVWLEHRVGTLAIGEPSVVVAVSAAHRAEAFEAARHGIDTLKKTVAVWKEEHWADGGSHFPGSP
ncbi:MAG TPA: molybdenum cofactor biosynthesis protein MoaE [Egibacteraceae bacterium]|jgi:molybdopterin synthase catalytic subunit|nr:molybdenum cofactor biosynthesis protein MoaE [Egibacteraceae bacterium]